MNWHNTDTLSNTKGLCAGSALLAFFTAVLYAQTVTFDFVRYDDPAYITENPMFTGGVGWDTAARAFSAPYKGLWTPLTWLSYAFDVRVHGMNPAGFHLSNVLLHSANAALLFVLLARMTKAYWASLAMACFFAWHPLRVEAVAWVAARKDLLSGFFILLGLMAYHRHSLRPSVTRYTQTLLAFALALMAKPSVLVFPGYLLLLDLWPLGRLSLDIPPRMVFRRATLLVFEKLPLFVLAVCAGMAAFVAQGEGLTPAEYVPFTAKLANAIISYGFYLAKSFVPTALAIPYPYNAATHTTAAVGGSLLILLAISAATVWKAKKRPFALVGWLWFLGGLLPVIGLIQFGHHARADRFTYVPQIGLIALVVWGLRHGARRYPRMRPLIAVLTVGALAACALLTVQQTRHWRDTRALFSHTVAVTQDNYLAHCNLGHALVADGEYRTAAEQYRRACALRPDSPESLNDLAVAMMLAGDTHEAAQVLLGTLDQWPEFVDARLNLAAAYYLLERYDEAETDVRRVLVLQPDNAKAAKLSGAIAQAMAARKHTPDTTTPNTAPN